MAMISTVRYFKSFSAISYPVEPLNEVELDAARKLVTYYEARFNLRGFLVEFTKHLKQEHPNGHVVWTKAFVEEYEYYATGHLKERRLIAPGGEKKVWRFNDEASAWSAYLDSLARSLNSDVAVDVASEQSPKLREIGLAGRLAFCHELMSELENHLFESIARQPRTADRILTSLTEQLPRFKELLQLICPESKPRILFLAEKTEATDTDAIMGFDMIGGVRLIEEHLERYLDRLLTTPEQVSLATIEDEDVKNWLVANEVDALFVMPIRARRNQELEVAGLLALAFSGDLGENTSPAIAAILRRFGQLCQTTIDIAQSAEQISESESD